MIVGIDFGSSLTKMIFFDKNKIIDKRITNSHTTEYIDLLKEVGLEKIEKIAICGAGSSYIDNDILGIPTFLADEFTADVKGAQYLSGLTNCMVVSLGTGTTFLYANEDKIEHAGGSGMGGALLSALCKMKYDDLSIQGFLDLGNKGDMCKADIMIKDIAKDHINDLYADVTAANMGKVDKHTSLEDYAAGVCNLVFQNVGVMTYLASKGYPTNKAIVLGTMASCAACRKFLDLVGALYNFEFIIPEDSGYATALGAVLSVQ